MRHRQLPGIIATAAVVLAAVVATAVAASLGQRPEAAAHIRPIDVFMCGQSTAGYHIAGTRAGLTMAVKGIHKPPDGGAPAIAVTFTTSTYMKMVSGSPTTFEVLYLRDGVIVGGGPSLNEAGDVTPQPVDMRAFGFPVYPNQHNVLDLGERTRLCGSLTWSDVWADPGPFEALVLHGHVVERDDGFRLLTVPSPLDESMLASRATLSA